MLNRLLRLLRLRFVRDLATLQIGQMFSMGCGMLTSIIYARLLGLEGYGQYAIVLALTGMIGPLTNLGQQTTAVTFFAEAFSKKDTDSMRKIFHYYLVASGLAASMLLVLMLILPMLAERLYGNSDIGSLARLVFLATILDIPLLFFSIVLQTVRRIRTVMVFENSLVVLQLALTTIFLLLGFGVRGILLSSVLGSLCFSLIAISLYPKVAREEGLPSMYSTLSVRGWRHLWKFGKDGFWIAIDKNLGNLYPNVFLFVFSTMVPATVMGLLRMALKLSGIPGSLVLTTVSRLSNTVIPSLIGKGTAVLRTNLRKLILHTIGLHTAVSLAAIVAIPLFIPVVYGNAFRPAIWPFIVITLLNISLSFHTFTTPILRLTSNIRIATLFNIAALGSGLLTLWMLIHFAGLPPIRALYAAIAVYSVIINLLVIPTMSIVRGLAKIPA